MGQGPTSDPKVVMMPISGGAMIPIARTTETDEEWREKIRRSAAPGSYGEQFGSMMPDLSTAVGPPLTPRSELGDSSRATGRAVSAAARDPGALLPESVRQFRDSLPTDAQVWDKIKAAGGAAARGGMDLVRGASMAAEDLDPINFAKNVKYALSPEGLEQAGGEAKTLLQHFDRGLVDVFGGERAFPDEPQAPIDGGARAPDDIAFEKPPAENTPMYPPGMGAGSLGMRFSGPGGGGLGIPGMPASVEGDLLASTQREQAAIQEKAKVQEQGLRAQADMQEKARQTYAAQENRLAEMQRLSAERQEQAMSAIQETQNQVSKMSTIDPNRLWKNMSTEGKILAGVSMIFGGFASGFAGSKDSAVDVIQNAIKLDVEAQQASFNNARAGLQDQITIYGMLRQRGLDDAEALKGAMAIGLQHADMIQKELATRAQADQVTLESQQLSEQLAQRSLMNVDQIRTRRHQLALQEAELKLKQNEMAMRVYLASMKAQGGGGRPLPIGGANTLAELKAGIARSNRLTESYKKNATAFFSGLTQFIPGTDAAGYRAQYELFIQTLGKALEGGVLREGDVTRYRTMLPTAGEFDENALAKLQLLEETFKKDYETYLQSYANAGYNVSAFQGQPGGGWQPQTFQPLREEMEE